MKKILVFFLGAWLCVLLTPTVLAVNLRDISFEETLALQLKELGLIQGVGKNEDETPDFQLNRPLNRVEALIMLVRALGKESEAEAYSKTHPFSDVPVWADGVVSYAYDNGLIKGVSDTLFDVNRTISTEIYLTLMLRALGYSDGCDFNWDTPEVLAYRCGILPTQVDAENFARADVVIVTCAALYAYMKGTQTTLYEWLVAEKFFTKEQFNMAFPADPFEDSRTLEDRTAGVIQFTYEEALEKTVANFNIDKKIETWQGTILIGSETVSSHGYTEMYMIIKANSALGEGTIVSLPLPLEGFYSPKVPDNIWLSEDGLTLYYTCLFNDFATIDMGEPLVLHENGAYNYATDLTTGETTLVIVPN